MGGDTGKTRATDPGPSLGWRYRTADGVVHYVGDEAQVPAAFRASAQPIDVAEIHLNRGLEKGLDETERATTARALGESPRAARHPPHWLPDLSLLVGIALLLAAAATLLHRLYRRRFMGSPRVWWASRIARWLAAFAVVLVLVRATLPHLGRWRKQLARFGLEALIADEERNSDVMRANIVKAALEAAGVGQPAVNIAPAAPFWAKPVPPPDPGRPSDGGARPGSR